jgi:hypothetical protein
VADAKRGCVFWRNEEYALFPQNYRFQIPADCRQKILGMDLLEAAIGLGPNLF